MSSEKRIAGGSGGGVVKKKQKKLKPSMKKVEATFVSSENEDKTPPLPGFNLAGRPDYLKNREGGLKKNQVKTSGPYHTPDINTESYWHFVIRSNKNEWIRFNPDSIFAVLPTVHLLLLLFFALLVSALVKFVRKTLMKLTPEEPS